MELLLVWRYLTLVEENVGQQVGINVFGILLFCCACSCSIYARKHRDEVDIHIVTERLKQTFVLLNELFKNRLEPGVEFIFRFLRICETKKGVLPRNISGQHHFLVFNRLGFHRRKLFSDNLCKIRCTNRKQEKNNQQRSHNKKFDGSILKNRKFTGVRMDQYQKRACFFGKRLN